MIHGYVAFDDPEPPWMPTVFAQCHVARPEALRAEPDRPDGRWSVLPGECIFEHARSHGRAWTLDEIEVIEGELFFDLALHMATAHGIWEPAIVRSALEQARVSDRVRR